VIILRFSVGDHVEARLVHPRLLVEVMVTVAR
jgi:hypothetical protein